MYYLSILQGEFVDDGTETHFEIGNHACCVKAVSSGKQKEGIIHTLLVDGVIMPEASEWQYILFGKDQKNLQTQESYHVRDFFFWKVCWSIYFFIY